MVQENKGDRGSGGTNDRAFLKKIQIGTLRRYARGGSSWICRKFEVHKSGLKSLAKIRQDKICLGGIAAR